MTRADYADQRYYGVGTGRFNTADPLGINVAKLQNPGSWNRYSYAVGDPINMHDPTGMTPCGDLLFKGQVEECYDPCDPATWENGFVGSVDPSCFVGPPPPNPVAETPTCASVFVPMLQNADHQDVLYRVLNENSFNSGGTDLLQEDAYIVSVLWNRTTQTALFPLQYGDSSSIDSQARYAGNPSKRTYNYQNLENLWVEHANMALDSAKCQNFIRNIELARQAVQLVISNQVPVDSSVFFWFRKGSTPTPNDGSVGALITTVDSTSFYGIR